MLRTGVKFEEKYEEKKYFCNLNMPEQLLRPLGEIILVFAPPYYYYYSPQFTVHSHKRNKICKIALNVVPFYLFKIHLGSQKDPNLPGNRLQFSSIWPKTYFVDKNWAKKMI